MSRWPAGAKLRQARRARGLSHDTLARIVGTSRQHLIRLEKGVHRPSPDMLGRICDALGMRPEDFSDDDDEEADLVPVSLDEMLRRAVRQILKSEGAL